MRADARELRHRGEHALRVGSSRAIARLHLRTAHNARLLPLLLLLALPAVVQAQFTWTTNSGTITITGYNGPAGDLTIPDTITDLPVTSIGQNAFFANTSLTSVTLGNNLTSIGGFAFHDCPSLTSVVIPNSVTNIGTYAFHACFGLASVTLGTSVTSIGESAFQLCPSLTDVTIPASVTNLGAYAFRSCYNLSVISVEAANLSYSSVAGVLFDKTQTTLIQYPGGKPGSFTVPTSVTSIGPSAFQASFSLTSVVIPNSVTNIGI